MEVSKAKPDPRQGSQVWRFDPTVIRANIAVPEIIGHDQDDVGRTLVGTCHCAERGDEERGDEERGKPLFHDAIQIYAYRKWRY